jgi:hypothetical protein
MKLKIIAAVATTLFSMKSSAWYIDTISCKKNNDPGDANKVTYTSIRGTALSQGTYLKDKEGGSSTPVSDPYSLTGTYASSTKLNSRTVWVGVFYFVEMYDGLNLESGKIMTASGKVYDSRIEIRFKPFTDFAYGPDFAGVDIYTRASAGDGWSNFESFKDCFVSVYH